MDTIYLDSNATTQPAPEVVRAMEEMNAHHWANPSSLHRMGQQVRRRMELARVAVARLIGARDREVVFTSGGTESNNLALSGALGVVTGRMRDAGRVLITSQIEHAAVRQPAHWLAERGVEVIDLPVNPHGQIDVTSLAAALEDQGETNNRVLISIQWANNETGVIQPIDAILRTVAQFRKGGDGRSRRVLLHVDATQAVGKLPVSVADTGIDLLTLASHKFHGPKGVGALYVRTGVRIPALLQGGEQEGGRRGGTENVPGIVGMGVAAELAAAFLDDQPRVAGLAALRDRLEQGILAGYPEAAVNGAEAPRVWNTSNIAFPGLAAEAMLLGLSERGLCASAGAACSSGSTEPSPVLRAMALDERLAHGSVRFSLSRHTGEAEIEQAIGIVREVAHKLGRTMPVGR